MQAVDVFGKRDPLSEVADTVFRLAHTEGAQFDLLIQSLAVVARADDELQLSEWIRTRCQTDPDRVIHLARLVDKKSPDDLRRDADLVVARIRQDIEPTGAPGRPKEGNPRNTGITKDDTASYVVATLKKRDPDLAAQVVAGELSAHAAALKAGIRKPRATFRTDDVRLAVAVLLKHFTVDQVAAALAAQTQGENK